MHKTIIDGVEIYTTPVKRLKVQRNKFDLHLVLATAAFGFSIIGLVIQLFYHVI